MKGADAYNILRDKGVDILHHANTVTTGCTFLQIGGLAARGYVEDHHLLQTPQYSDDTDKKLGIWHDVFTDGVDIHARGSVRNKYGPVLFMLPATILLDLPKSTDVLVTRNNPIYWKSSDKPRDCYFLSPEELSTGYQYGDFGKHIVLRTKLGLMPFHDSPLHILLDDPQRRLPEGVDAYTHAVQRLTKAAKEGRLKVDISKRQCKPTCGCLSGDDRGYATADLEFLF